MPSPSTTQLPIPKSWDEFEDICSDYLTRIWNDPYVVRHGRSGQRQNGVDIYGKPQHLQHAQYAGAQCKRVDAVTKKMVDDEVEQSLEFEPTLTEFLILTTASRDSTIQKHVREKDTAFRLEIRFWEDISLFISGHNDLLQKHFPGWAKQKTSKDDVLQLLMRANVEEFTYNDGEGLYVYSQDIKLCLQITRDDRYHAFKEPWVHNYPNPSAKKFIVKLKYEGVSIEDFWCISVDGGRYYIPMPTPPPELKITPTQYKIGSILNTPFGGYDFDSGLRRGGITVDHENQST